MSEPSERDFEVAAEFLDCERPAAIHLARLLNEARKEGRREAIDAVLAQQASPPWYAKETQLAAIRNCLTSAETPITTEQERAKPP